MDRDEIINKRVRRIAEDHGCTVAEVYEVLDRHPIELDRDTYLKRTLALELLRLDELEEAFREKALLDRDVSAGVLLVKVAERRFGAGTTHAPKKAASGRYGRQNRNTIKNPNWRRL